MKEISAKQFAALDDRLSIVKIAETGDDFGSHSESIIFNYSLGFILTIWDIRIGCLYYQITKDEYLEWMSRYYDEQMLYCDVEVLS